MYPDREPDRLLGGGGSHPGINYFNWRSTLRSHSLDLEVDLVVDWIRLFEKPYFCDYFFFLIFLYMFFFSEYFYFWWLGNLFSFYRTCCQVMYDKENIC